MEGEWLVETLWGSAADAASPGRADHPAAHDFLACIDADTSVVRSYETLD